MFTCTYTHFPHFLGASPTTLPSSGLYVHHHTTSSVYLPPPFLRSPHPLFYYSHCLPTYHRLPTSFPIHTQLFCSPHILPTCPHTPFPRLHHHHVGGLPTLPTTISASPFYLSPPTTTTTCSCLPSVLHHTTCLFHLEPSLLCHTPAYSVSISPLPTRFSPTTSSGSWEDLHFSSLHYSTTCHPTSCTYACHSPACTGDCLPTCYFHHGRCSFGFCAFCVVLFPFSPVLYTPACVHHHHHAHLTAALTYHHPSSLPTYHHYHHTTTTTLIAVLFTRDSTPPHLLLHLIQCIPAACTFCSYLHHLLLLHLHSATLHFYHTSPFSLPTLFTLLHATDSFLPLMDSSTPFSTQFWIFIGSACLCITYSYSFRFTSLPVFTVLHLNVSSTTPLLPCHLFLLVWLP